MVKNGKWAYLYLVPTKQLTRQYNTAPKLEAREVTVIESYRAWSGKPKLGGEIWALGGKQERNDPGSEINQYLAAGFIRHANQYRGFNIEPADHHVSQREFPDAFWHNWNIVVGAERLCSLGLFPDLVFADFTNWVGCISHKTNKDRSGVLPRLLDQLPNNPLIVVNMCAHAKRNPNFSKQNDDLEAELSKHVYPRGWKRTMPTADLWEYDGKNKERMMTFWLERA